MLKPDLGRKTMFDIEGKKGGDVCVIARIIHKNHLHQSDKRVYR